jgi:hypothetical protein
MAVAPVTVAKRPRRRADKELDQSEAVQAIGKQRGLMLMLGRLVLLCYK